MKGILFMVLDLKEIGNRIRSLRNSENMSLQQFADSIDCDKSTLSRIENGKISPTIYCFCMISEKYGLSLNYLIFGRQESSEIQEQLLKISQAVQIIRKNT